MARILLLNGPNLNLLGTREPELYGAESLGEVEAELTDTATKAGHELECFQSNSESALIEKIHAEADADFGLLNLGAFTHTSVAIRDALLCIELPFIEVHISNVQARESFRQQNFVGDIAIGSVVGLGTYGYILALNAAIYALRADDE